MEFQLARTSESNCDLSLVQFSTQAPSTNARLQHGNQLPSVHPQPLQDSTNTLNFQQPLTQIQPQKITAQLENEDLWQKFHSLTNEMMLNKPGRRMFPRLRVKLSGMDVDEMYCVVIVIEQADRFKYRYEKDRWKTNGAAKPLPSRQSYTHSSSPARGGEWMKDLVSFDKVKLTNSSENVKKGKFLLHSLHHYIPRIYVIRSDDVNDLSEKMTSTFSFAETSFVTVTTYMNPLVIELKIDSNPFAKGFKKNKVRKRKLQEQTDEDLKKFKSNNEKQNLQQTQENNTLYLTNIKLQNVPSDVASHTTAPQYALQNDLQSTCQSVPYIQQNLLPPALFQSGVPNSSSALLSLPSCSQSHFQQGYMPYPTTHPGRSYQSSPMNHLAPQQHPQVSLNNVSGRFMHDDCLRSSAAPFAFAAPRNQVQPSNPINPSCQYSANQPSSCQYGPEHDYTWNHDQYYYNS